MSIRDRVSGANFADEEYGIAFRKDSDITPEVNKAIDELAKEVFENIDAVDAVIDKYSIGWKKSRLHKTTLAILRLAICEMMFVDSIPCLLYTSRCV